MSREKRPRMLISYLYNKLIIFRLLTLGGEQNDVFDPMIYYWRGGGGVSNLPPATQESLVGYWKAFQWLPTGRVEI